MPFSLVDHQKEILKEVVGRLQRWADLAKGSQIRSFDLIQVVKSVKSERVLGPRVINRREE